MASVSVEVTLASSILVDTCAAVCPGHLAGLMGWLETFDRSEVEFVFRDPKSSSSLHRGRHIALQHFSSRFILKTILLGSAS